MQFFRRFSFKSNLYVFNVFFFTDEHVYRGCLSDSSDHRLLCDQDQKKNHSCITCEESGCNDTPKIRPSTLSCIQCRGSHECAFGFEKDSASRCKADVRLGLEESCYIYYRNGMTNQNIQFYIISYAVCKGAGWQLLPSSNILNFSDVSSKNSRMFLNITKSFANKLLKFCFGGPLAPLI